MSVDGPRELRDLQRLCAQQLRWSKATLQDAVAQGLARSHVQREELGEIGDSLGRSQHEEPEPRYSLELRERDAWPTDAA